jgi:hypothetical protein
MTELNQASNQAFRVVISIELDVEIEDGPSLQAELEQVRAAIDRLLQSPGIRVRSSQIQGVTRLRSNRE